MDGDFNIDDVFLTVREVAAFCKMREATVRLWIRNGDLRAVKFGREWRVAKQDLQAFAEARVTNR